MRFFLLFSLTVFACQPLAGQSPIIDQKISDYLSTPLKAMQAMAYDSISHYRKLESGAAAAGKQLMRNDKLAQYAFGHSAPEVYLERYGQDTGRLIITTVNNWDTYRRRQLRWEYVYGRVNELKSKNGRTELHNRYGIKLVTMLKDEKKRKEIFRRELVRGSIFFHKWHEGINKYELTRSGGGRVFYSMVKIAEGTKDFSSRGKLPEPAASVTAGGSIPASDILFSHPQNQQANFYLLENRRGNGQISLRNYIGGSIREASNEAKLWVRWKSAKGKVLYTRAAVAGKTITYRIPTHFLSPREVYELAIVKSDTDLFNSVLDFYAGKDLGQLIAQGVYHREKKEVAPAEVYFKAYFRVSEYGSFFAKTLEGQFARLDAPGTAYEVNMEEPFGPEEIEGLHGLGPQANFSAYGCKAVESTLAKLYGSSARTFYAHPRQEYVDYLERHRDSLNVDSLVAIEFLPLKERVGKYRRLRYTNAEGKRMSASSRGLPLPPKPEQRRCIFISSETQPITPEIYQDPSLYRSQASTLTIRDTFAEAVQRIALTMAPLLEERAEEYADILRQLNELSPQATGGKSFAKIVEDINVWYVMDPYNEELVAPQTCFPKIVNASYSFPLRGMMTTSGRIDVRAPEK